MYFVRFLHFTYRKPLKTGMMHVGHMALQDENTRDIFIVNF